MLQLSGKGTEPCACIFSVLPELHRKHQRIKQFGPDPNAPLHCLPHLPNIYSSSNLAGSQSTDNNMSFTSRQVDKLVLSRAQREGVGATVRRSIGGGEVSF